MGGARKKEKAHKMPPEYTITEDDVDMVAQMIQDRTVEDFDNVRAKGTELRKSWHTCDNSSSNWRSAGSRKQV
jgi:hypothetical protein